MLKPIDRNLSRMVRNILAVWEGASTDERIRGMWWYHNANAQAQRIATTYEVDVRTVSTVISILSPGNKWERNVDEAERLLVAFLWGDTPDSVRVSTYGQNKTKAWAFLQGTLDVPFGPRAPKTRAFAALIANPQSRQVCIDGHATNIALAGKGPISGVPEVTPKRYRTISAAYRLAATSAGVHPHQMQAVTWVAWR